MSKLDERERAPFEKWADEQQFCIYRDDTDKYRDYHRVSTRFAWQAWSARAALAGAPAPSGPKIRVLVGNVSGQELRVVGWYDDTVFVEAAGAPAPDCLHTTQLWNIAGTHGHCKDCGKQFGEGAGGPAMEVAAGAPAQPDAILTDEQLDKLDTFSLNWMAPRGYESVRQYGRAVEKAVRRALAGAAPSDAVKQALVALVEAVQRQPDEVRIAVAAQVAAAEAAGASPSSSLVPADVACSHCGGTGYGSGGDLCAACGGKGHP